MLNRKMSPEEAIERIEIILKNSKSTQADKLALKSAISAFAYINQLEAEVERLTNKCDDCAGCTQWKCDCANIESEAIKAFAEKINRVIDIHLERYSVADFDEFKAISQALRGLQNNIDSIVKETVGDENV